MLVDHFLRKHAQRAGKQIDGIEDAARAVLQAYDWPGNIRELENTIECAVVLSTEETITERVLSLLTAAALPSWNGLPSSNLHQNQEWVERENDPSGARSNRGCKEGCRRTDRNQPAVPLSHYLAKHRVD